VDTFIDAAEKANAYIAAICAAPMILGKRGLLRGRQATCFPGFEEYLEGAAYMDVHTVTDGRYITGRAMGAATEFALALIKVLKGEGAADDLRAAVFA
jgi:4-methyl-5(b-hydroxyethyl)-thiazole monophosphate biosynthesis